MASVPVPRPSQLVWVSNYYRCKLQLRANVGERIEFEFLLFLVDQAEVGSDVCWQLPIQGHEYVDLFPVPYARQLSSGSKEFKKLSCGSSPAVNTLQFFNLSSIGSISLAAIRQPERALNRAEEGGSEDPAHTSHFAVDAT